MIELNCSYEESKKILELGYDFSPVCATFSASGKTSSHGLPFATMIINPSLKGVGHLENLNHLKSLPYMRLDKEIDIDSIVPIIPKAALENCLPDKLDIASFMTSVRSLGIYTRRDNCVFVKNIDLKTISLFYFFEDYYSCYEEQKEFKSAYKAFIWCHKNYPEVLKKKFSEVMA